MQTNARYTSDSGNKYRIPTVSTCCGCVTDLKTAVAIIAVLGIVTSPSVSWAIIRHAFVIRVSCYVTTNAEQADVVDVNLNNILSFGFGANAGLGPSCLSSKNKTRTQTLMMRSSKPEDLSNNTFVKVIRYIGWGVLFTDLVFLVFSVNFLIRIFRPPDRKAMKQFMISCIITILASFMFGMLYVGACIKIGGAFPIFEIVFSFIDLITWSYYLVVVYSYKTSTS